MTYNKVVKKLFSYPKVIGPVPSAGEETSIHLDTETLSWLEKVLYENFNDKIKKISHHRIRPWSRLFEVETNQKKNYFLKIPASEFCQEADIINLVDGLNLVFTPKILAQNKKNGAFLMAKHPGETLRANLRKIIDQPNQSILLDSATKIGGFQAIARDNIIKFEQLGVPKWTHETIIKGCKSLIENPRFLLYTKLSSSDLVKLKTLFPSIEEKLTILTEFENGLSVDHGDFQDNNIFICEDYYLIMDWADTCVSIPSFTIATYCHSILLAHPDITGNSELIQNILENYYLNIVGTKFNELHKSHLSLVHVLYPMICILKIGRLFNLKNKQSDGYSSFLIDYWIKVVISFSKFY